VRLGAEFGGEGGMRIGGFGAGQFGEGWETKSDSAKAETTFAFTQECVGVGLEEVGAAIAGADGLALATDIAGAADEEAVWIELWYKCWC
jgi:hypothetical protein